MTTSRNKETDGLERTGNWRTNRTARFSGASIEALFNNEVPAVGIPAFASAAECDALLTAISSLAFRNTHFNPASVQRIGPSYFGFKDRKDAYFEAAGRHAEDWIRLVENTIDPVQRLVATMAGAGVALRRAYEPGYGHYAPSFIKKRTGSQLLHTDTAMMMHGWALRENTSQVAWNLYLQLAQGHDSTTIYDRLEKPGDEEFTSVCQDYYLEDVVGNADSVTIRPAVGDLIFINSCNYHCVHSSDNDRITIGGFLAPAGTGAAIYWA
ncbi:MAG: hypothetical protein U5R46_00210 [Gammaproteobacteria bacterium]|nr:hypothetical protein [Gammaproteobacteria bacterium]